LPLRAHFPHRWDLDGGDGAGRVRAAFSFLRTPKMPTLLSPAVAPIVLLVLSNVFMTVAWYWHLKFPNTLLVKVILISWIIALFEYCLAVPANRIGHGYYSAAQLKTMQEVITLVVFALFSWLYLKEPLGWNHLVGFTMIAGGAAFIFHKF
jgi:uncharacterized protein (DUF486 family)